MLQSRWLAAAAGLIVGLVIAANWSGRWPTVAVHATATHGQENFAIATGPIGRRHRSGLYPRLFDRRTEGGRAQSADRQIHVVLRAQHAQDLTDSAHQEPRYRDGHRHGRHAPGQARARSAARSSTSPNSPADRSWPTAFPGRPVASKPRCRSKGSLSRWTASVSDASGPFELSGRASNATPACRPPAAVLQCGSGVNWGFHGVFASLSRRRRRANHGQRHQREVAEGTSIAALLAELDVPRPGRGRSESGVDSPRPTRRASAGEPGDRLEVVTLVGGG